MFFNLLLLFCRNARLSFSWLYCTITFFLQNCWWLTCLSKSSALKLYCLWLFSTVNMGRLICFFSRPSKTYKGFWKSIQEPSLRFYRVLLTYVKWVSERYSLIIWTHSRLQELIWAGSCRIAVVLFPCRLPSSFNLHNFSLDYMAKMVLCIGV